MEQKVEPAIALPLDANSRCDGFGFDDFRGETGDGTPVCRVPVLRETLPNGATYLVIDHQTQELDNFAEITIPEGHVFVMGDNRDHSADSRELNHSRGLLGPIPLENIGGRAEFITFSLDGTTSLNPVSWWTSLREGRAWSTLRPAIAERKAAAER